MARSQHRGASRMHAASDAAADHADYVIVGGGTGGCALAARLCAALPRSSFVLLERGTPRNDTEDFLATAMRAAYDAWTTPSMTESWDSEPNPGLFNRTLEILTGSTLGGTSVINGAQWTRPEAAVPAGWGVNGLTAEVAEAAYSAAYDQLQVAAPPPELQQTYVRARIAASAAAGIPEIDDPVGKSEDGIWVNRLYADAHGRRRDSCTAYLMPVMGPDGACADNLQLVQGATATRIVTARGRAHAVEYTSAGAARVVAARREVISCAGPYGSPKLLQLSGIGPRGLLEERGVRLVKDLPVGAAAQGRPNAYIAHAYAGVPLAPENNASLLAAPATRARFAAGDGGPLGIAIGGSNGVVEDADAMIVSTDASPDGEAANRPFLLSFCFLNPAARATVRIASADPLQPPRVNLNILGAPTEAPRALQCLRRMRDVAANFPPSFDLQEVSLETQQLTETYVRNTTVHAYHFVGACSVGAVLDGDLRVHGFSNLRVVDASAIPAIPRNAGPSSSVFMLAEFAAERIANAAGVKGWGGTKRRSHYAHAS